LPPAEADLDLKYFKFRYCRVDEKWMTIRPGWRPVRHAGEHAAYGNESLGQPVQRDASSGTAYRPEDVATLETLDNLRAVGLRTEGHARYLRAAGGDEASGESGELFEAMPAAWPRGGRNRTAPRYWTSRSATERTRGRRSGQGHAVAEETRPDQSAA